MISRFVLFTLLLETVFSCGNLQAFMVTLSYPDTIYALPGTETDGHKMYGFLQQNGFQITHLHDHGYGRKVTKTDILSKL